jgi:xanthine dehydrogenase molybdenum-binding subunit
MKRLDTTKAEALPRVKAIITAKDFPINNDRFINFTQTMANPRMIAENVLASEKVLYIGHAITAVAATDVHIAEEAAHLIEVEYEILEPVFTVKESMKDGAR